MRQVVPAGQVAPYETRSEPEGDPLALATQAVNELRSSSEQFQQRMEAGWQDVGDRVTALEARLSRPSPANDNRSDAEAELEQRAFDRFLRYGRDSLTADEVRALSVTGGANEGATTVPEAFLAEIIKDLTEISPMRSLARVTNVSGTPVLLPRRTAAPVGAWEGETTEAGETSSAYDQWSIPVHEARVYTDISNRLLEDSAFDMAGEIREDLTEAFDELESGAFVNGDGNGKPLGFLADPAFQTTELSGASFDADDLIDLFYSIKARYRRRGTWTMNSSTIAIVRKLKYPDGKHLWQDSLAEGQPPTLLGRPVEEFPDLPDPDAEAVPLVFGDFNRAYRIVQRLALVVLPDRYSKATESIVRFHARMRVGGKLVLPAALRGLQMPE